MIRTWPSRWASGRGFHRPLPCFAKSLPPEVWRSFRSRRQFLLSLLGPKLLGPSLALGFGGFGHFTEGPFKRSIGLSITAEQIPLNRLCNFIGLIKSVGLVKVSPHRVEHRKRPIDRFIILISCFLIPRLSNFSIGLDAKVRITSGINSTNLTLGRRVSHFSFFQQLLKDLFLFAVGDRRSLHNDCSLFLLLFLGNTWEWNGYKR
jgi:hypothetical protein